MRYGEDYWTPEEAENGMAPSTAVYDAQTGVYREVIEVDNLYDSTPTDSEELARAFRHYHNQIADMNGPILPQGEPNDYGG